MNEKESYQNIIAELQDSLQGLEDKLSSPFQAGAEPVVEFIECMVITEELLKEVYHAYFSAEKAPEEDQAAHVLYELAQEKLVTPYLVEEFMEAQRAVILFRRSEHLQEHALYQEYLTKIPLFNAMLRAVLPVIEQLPRGLDIRYEERDHEEE